MRDYCSCSRLRRAGLVVLDPRIHGRLCHAAPDSTLQLRPLHLRLTRAGLRSKLRCRRLARHTRAAATHGCGVHLDRCVGGHSACLVGTRLGWPPPWRVRASPHVRAVATSMMHVVLLLAPPATSSPSRFEALQRPSELSRLVNSRAGQVGLCKLTCCHHVALPCMGLQAQFHDCRHSQVEYTCSGAGACSKVPSPVGF